MLTVTASEIQTDLLRYLERVRAGDTFLIIRAGEPIAEVGPPGSLGGNLRPIGLCAGEFVVPGDFDDPLPEEILLGFEG